MTMPKKTSVITALSILALCAFVFFGFRGFVGSIRNQRTCEWANIDNLELHAHIDIPKVTGSDCAYEKETNTKKAHFTIDLKNFDMNRYVHRHHFKALTPASEIDFGNFLNLGRESIDSPGFYYKKGSQDGEKWDVLLDQKTGNLWITVQYKD